jgi:dipeptidyl aminopeptidase/acylaminoacyl peptidase
MRTEQVDFWSEGARLRGWLRRPDGPAERLPFVVQGPGWLGLAGAKLYQPYHEAFSAAGFAVFIFDYRGFGESEGDRGTLSPARQIEDWRNALAYMRGRSDMDPVRAAIFGSGGTGGGHAVAVAALESSVRATISQVPVADGRDWLHRMRTEHEWIAFLASVEADRRARATTGTGTVVHPRRGIMVETPERHASAVKSDVDARIPSAVPLSAAQEILEYRPLDLAPRVRGLMVVAVEHDAVTPTDHARRLYQAALSPKKLVIQERTTHYAAYEQYAGQVIPMMVEWLRTLVMRDAPIDVVEE